MHQYDTGKRNLLSEERVGVGGEGGENQICSVQGAALAAVRCGGAGWGMLVWAEDGAVWVGKKGVE